jgi:uncharacterized protein YlxW (UPF0749 family)
MALNRITYFYITIFAVVVGLMLALQFRTASSRDLSVPLDRAQELTIEKKQLEKDVNQLQEEATDLESKLEEAVKSHAGAAGALESELYKIKLYAGLLPVVGPGVEVGLDSTPGAGMRYGDHEGYIIKDEDLLKVLNDLRGAGSEAIAVNGQRILATSEVRLAGNHINVNLTRLSSPYKIIAIGNPGTLKSSLELKGGLVEYLSEQGALVSVETKEQIRVPAYDGPLRLEYARPAQK